MTAKPKNNGFSLTEVLIAMAILATAMVFIAGIFPAAIHLSAISTERVNAAETAQQAFTTIRFYAKGEDEPAGTPSIQTDDFNPQKLSQLDCFETGDMEEGKESFAFIIEDSDKVFPTTEDIEPDVFAYPSDSTIELKNKQYFWSAVLRLDKNYNKDTNPVVNVRVFVSRKVRPGLKYYDPNEFYSGTLSTQNAIDYPIAVPIEVQWKPETPDRLIIEDSDKKTLINDGYTIVDDETGRIYRVLERLTGSEDNVLVLDKNWDTWWWNWNNAQQKYLWEKEATRTTDIRIWVVPKPVNGTRNPCIAIYEGTLNL